METWCAFLGQKERLGLGNKYFITGHRYTKICQDERTRQMDGSHVLDKKRYINIYFLQILNFNFAIISIFI